MAAAASTSGSYSFHPLTEERVEPTPKERELSRLQRDLDTVLRASSARIDIVAAKAMQLNHRIRKRPESVTEMKAVLRSTPVPPSDE